MKKTDLCPQPLLSLQTHIKLKGVPVSRIDRKRFSQTGGGPSHHPLRCLLGIFWVSLSVSLLPVSPESVLPLHRQALLPPPPLSHN